MRMLQSHLVGFEPRTEGQKELFAEAHRGFSRLAELRGRRLQSVREGLPGPLWTIVLAGALSQHCGHLVFRHEKPKHACLDDRHVFGTSGSPDFSARR